jgi:hypothetical protein
MATCIISRYLNQIKELILKLEKLRLNIATSRSVTIEGQSKRKLKKIKR